MIRRLRAKFTLITLSLVTLVLLAVLTGIGVFFAQGIREQGDRSLEMALSRAENQLPPKLQVGGQPPADFHRDPVFVISISGGDVALLMSDRMEVDAADLDAIAAAVIQADAPTGELSQYNLRYLLKETPRGLRAAFIDMTEEKRMVGGVVLTCGLVGILAVAAFFVVSLLLSRWALRPVEQAWTQQRRFVSDASHELKTPLTVILASMEILRAHPRETVDSQMKWVENTAAEAGRMKGLVEDLLFLAKRDDVGDAVVMHQVNLSDAASHTALLFESKAYEQGVAISTHIEPDVMTLGDEAQLKQLAGILLDNAIKYSAQHGMVTLEVAKKHGVARLSVHNSGQAIPEAARSHLFERFYRADVSRSSDGYGLGLSIAKSIVDAHRGKIAVESSIETGTVFSVSFLPSK